MGKNYYYFLPIFNKNAIFGKKGPYYVILGQKSDKRTMFFGKKVDIVDTQKAIFVVLWGEGEGDNFQIVLIQNTLNTWKIPSTGQKANIWCFGSFLGKKFHIYIAILGKSLKKQLLWKIGPYSIIILIQKTKSVDLGFGVRRGGN